MPGGRVVSIEVAFLPLIPRDSNEKAMTYYERPQRLPEEGRTKRLLLLEEGITKSEGVSSSFFTDHLSIGRSLTKLTGGSFMIHIKASCYLDTTGLG